MLITTDGSNDSFERIGFCKNVNHGLEKIYGDLPQAISGNLSDLGLLEIAYTTLKPFRRSQVSNYSALRLSFEVNRLLL